MLPDLGEEANRRDGFVERILMAWPAAKPMRWTEATAGSGTAWEVEHIFKKLRIRRVADDQGLVLRFSAEARQAFARWYDENGRIVEESSGLAAGCYAKYPGQLARIALVLHCLHHPGDTTREIDADTISDAIAVVEYLRQHLVRILPSFGAVGSTKTASLERRVLRILTRAGGEWIARRELRRGLGNSAPAEEVRDVLERLATEGKVENRTVPTGARPREESRVPVPHNAHMHNSRTEEAESAYVHLCDGDREEVRV